VESRHGTGIVMQLLTRGQGAWSRRSLIKAGVRAESYSPRTVWELMTRPQLAGGDSAGSETMWAPSVMHKAKLGFDANGPAMLYTGWRVWPMGSLWRVRRLRWGAENRSQAAGKIEVDCGVFNPENRRPMRGIERGRLGAIQGVSFEGRVQPRNLQPDGRGLCLNKNAGAGLGRGVAGAPIEEN